MLWDICIHPLNVEVNWNLMRFLFVLHDVMYCWGWMRMVHSISPTDGDYTEASVHMTSSSRHNALVRVESKSKLGTKVQTAASYRHQIKGWMLQPIHQLGNYLVCCPGSDSIFSSSHNSRFLARVHLDSADGDWLCDVVCGVRLKHQA